MRVFNPIRGRVRSSWILLILLTAASVADAQEYKIKLVRPAKAGDRYTTNVTMNVKQSVTAGAGQPGKDESYPVEFAGEVKVDTVDDKSFPTKLTCTIDHFTKDGKDLYPAHAVITAEKTASGLVVYKIDNQPATQNLDLIPTVLELDGAELDDMFGTKEPQKVGGSWTVDLAKTAATLTATGLPIKEKDLKGDSTLKRARKLNGTPVLEVTTKMNADSFEGTVAKIVKVTDGSLSVETTTTVPVDETQPLLAKSTTVNAKMTVHTPHGDLATTSQREVKETHTAIKP